MNDRGSHGSNVFLTRPARHLLGVQGMHPSRITPFLDLAEHYALLNRSRKTPRDLLRGAR